MAAARKKKRTGKGRPNTSKSSRSRTSGRGTSRESGGRRAATGPWNERERGRNRLILDMLLLVVTAALFTLSFPSFVSDRGWWPLAYIALAPAVFVVNWSTVKRAIGYGFFCGMLTYMLHNYWIGSFHVLATLIVPGIYGIYYMILFPVLGVVGRRFGRFGYLVQALVWLSYEYLRTLGFLGYAYGILGYSQYSHPALVRFSSVTGIWGISLLVIIPSFFLAQVAARSGLFSRSAPDPASGAPAGQEHAAADSARPAGQEHAASGASAGQEHAAADSAAPRAQGNSGEAQHGTTGNSGSALLRVLREIGLSLSSYRADIAAYVGIFAVVLVVGGVFLRTDYSDSRDWRVALVQQNVDPHQGGITAYRESLDRSIRQSEAALERDDGIEAVIWSETSFVPPIEYHSRFRENPETLELVSRIQAFMSEQQVPYIIGNSDARRERQPDGSVERVDYNAALLFENGSIQDIYRKVHLVPFTEHFPYRNALPWVYDLLKEFDTHFWGQGTEYTVFETSDGVSFATPICFEDTFGYLSRNFVRAGADVIVNLTNDRWADSVSAAMQHMAMAVFRSGENRRTMVRGTNGGMTAIIDPNGVITAMDEPLVESHMIADAPVYDESSTLYTRFGDWFAQLVLIVTIGLLGYAQLSGRRSRSKR